MQIKNYLFTVFIKYIFMVLLICIPTIVIANPTLIINDEKTSYTDFTVDYLIEAPGEFLDITDIQERNFSKEISNKISLGYTHEDVWFRVAIHNNTSVDKKMILEFTEVFHEVVDLYIISKPIIYKKNGLLVPIKKRDIKEATPSFLLPLKAGEEKIVYMKILSTHGLFAAIELKSEETFYKNIQTEKYVYLAYFVAISTLVLYTLIHFLYFRERIYAYYIIFVLLFAIWIANFKGFLLPFLGVETYNILQVIIPLSFISFILFSQAVLETKKQYIKLHKIFDTVIYISIISIIWMIVSIKSALYFTTILAIPLFLVILIMSIWLLNKKNILVRLYILALIIYTIGIISLALLALGFLPYSPLLSNLIVFVSALVIILFSMLLAYRINLIRKESFESREELLEQQKTESTRLFHTVSEKTKELNRAKKDLEQELQKKIELQIHLQHLASTDPMTELSNRRAFFEVSELEVAAAKSNQENLACLIIDIDHFKKINDTHGHDVGDQVITAVSKLMLLNTRTKDHVGRIGGEEFAVLMPKTNQASAYQIADRLRDNISKHTIAVDDESIKITVSIGLTYLNDKKDESIHTLLKRADTALYKAKNNGRNQVCCLPERD